MWWLQVPVITPEGHIFERHAIEDWVKRHACSPYTQAPLTVQQLRPVPAFGAALALLQRFAADRDALIHRLSVIKGVVQQPLHSERNGQQ